MSEEELRKFRSELSQQNKNQSEINYEISIVGLRVKWRSRRVSGPRHHTIGQQCHRCGHWPSEASCLLRGHELRVIDETVFVLVVHLEYGINHLF